MFLLGYLWNKNINTIDPNIKEEVIKEILKPSIGSIIGICRKLDIDRVIFGNKKLGKLTTAINNYPNLRNEKIGHGYVFDDNIKSCNQKLNELIDIGVSPTFPTKHPLRV